jgi:cytidylate kinase
VRNRKGYIIAIDGPSGAGKSTVSGRLARALKGVLLDTGAMYRNVAYLSIKQRVHTPAGYRKIARSIRFSVNIKTNSVLVNGRNLGQKLRTEEVSQLASHVSRFPEVRAILTLRQQQLGRLLSRKFPVVVEGRDIGTVVFPKAPFKFFVTADPKVRARRRYQQLCAQGVRNISPRQILLENTRRDECDSRRKTAPLRCPADAVIVDTSKMPTKQVVRFLATHILKSTGSGPV